MAVAEQKAFRAKPGVLLPLGQLLQPCLAGSAVAVAVAVGKELLGCMTIRNCQGLSVVSMLA